MTSKEKCGCGHPAVDHIDDGPCIHSVCPCALYHPAEHSPSKESLAYAMRQADRCRNYGPAGRVDNENTIVILGDEIERLQRELASFQKANAELALRGTHEPPVGHDIQCWVEGSMFKWSTDGGGERQATAGELVMWAEIERLRAPSPPPASPAEVAWLIEFTAFPEPLYFAAVDGGAVGLFDKDHLLAVRFARKEDGEKVLRVLKAARRAHYDDGDTTYPRLLPLADDCYAVTEHMWCGPSETKSVLGDAAHARCDEDAQPSGPDSCGILPSPATTLLHEQPAGCHTWCGGCHCEQFLELYGPHADKLAEWSKAERLEFAPPADKAPLDSVRWICPDCTTVNGIADSTCLGCRKPRTAAETFVAACEHEWLPFSNKDAPVQIHRCTKCHLEKHKSAGSVVAVRPESETTTP